MVINSKLIMQAYTNARTKAKAKKKEENAWPEEEAKYGLMMHDPKDPCCVCDTCQDEMEGY